MLEAVETTNCASIPYKVKFFFSFHETSRLVLGPTEFPIQRVPRGKNEAAVSPQSLCQRLARAVTYLFPMLLLY